jgi:hypothetical protein
MLCGPLPERIRRSAINNGDAEVEYFQLNTLYYWIGRIALNKRVDEINEEN